jgi:hypothetical protein
MKQVIVAVCTLITCLAGTSQATTRAAFAGPSCPPGDYTVCIDDADELLCETDVPPYRGPLWACADLVEAFYNCGVTSGGYGVCDLDEYGAQCPYTHWELHCPGINE